MLQDVLAIGSTTPSLSNTGLLRPFFVLLQIKLDR